jgi:lysozyme
MSRQTNQAGIDLIKSFEGLRLTAYYDQVGVLTVGYGHTGSDVFDGQVIDEAAAESLLRGDLARFESAVDGAITVDVSDNQFAAMVSFTYNLGPGNFEKSTLLKLVNQQDFAGAADEFPKWDRAGGVVSAGILRRRNAERDLFLQA